MSRALFRRQVPLGVVLTLHFIPCALLEQLRAQASAVNRQDHKVCSTQLVRFAAFYCAWPCRMPVSHVLLQALSRCGMAAVAAGKMHNTLHSNLIYASRPQRTLSHAPQCGCASRGHAFKRFLAVAVWSLWVGFGRAIDEARTSSRAARRNVFGLKILQNNAAFHLEAGDMRCAGVLIELGQFLNYDNKSDRKLQK
jgi:hypothetical protein